ncbi:MAG: tetratricopeptide repeat protein [Rhodothermales bacterium]
MVRKGNLTWAAVLLLTGLALAPILSLGAVLPVSAQNLRSEDLDVQFYRAETALKSGASVLEAKARIDRVLTARPNDAEALKLRSRILMSMDRYDDALRDAKRAVQLVPSDGEAYVILSEAARLAGDDHLAVESLDAAAERVMEDAEFHLRLSWNAALLGHLERSEAYARIALALDPERAAAYYQLARVFVQRDQLADAASTLARGLEQDLLDPVVILSDSLLAPLSTHEQLDGMLN